MRRSVISSVLLGALSLSLTALANTAVEPANTATKPAAVAGKPNTAVVPVVRRANEPWMKRHLGLVEASKKATDCQILFLGDSITDHWRSKGIETWEANYVPLHPVNLGISGDRTQNLLWRLQNGELGPIKPKAIVMMIGTNNIGLNSDGKTRRNTVPEIAAGIEANVNYLREQLPDAKILLLAVFPRGEKDSQERADVAAVNQIIAKLDDGKNVFFLDIGPKFMEADGTLPKTIMPDLLHPNADGYKIWAEAMREPLANLLK